MITLLYDDADFKKLWDEAGEFAYAVVQEFFINRAICEMAEEALV